MMDREFVVIEGQNKGKVMYVINCSEASGYHKAYCTDVITGEMYYMDATSLKWLLKATENKWKE